MSSALSPEALMSWFDAIEPNQPGHGAFDAAFESLVDVNRLGFGADVRVITRAISLLSHSDGNAQWFALKILLLLQEENHQTVLPNIVTVLPRLCVLIDGHPDDDFVQYYALRLANALGQVAQGPPLREMLDAKILEKLVRILQTSDDRTALWNAFLAIRAFSREAAHAKSRLIDSGAADGVFRMLIRGRRTNDDVKMLDEFLKSVPLLRDDLLSMLVKKLDESDEFAKSFAVCRVMACLTEMRPTPAIASVESALWRIDQWLGEDRLSHNATLIVCRLLRDRHEDSLHALSPIVTRQIPRLIESDKDGVSAFAVLCCFRYAQVPKWRMPLVVAGVLGPLVRLLESPTARKGWSNALWTISSLSKDDGCLQHVIRADVFTKLTTRVVAAQPRAVNGILRDSVGRVSRELLEVLVRRGCVRPLLGLLLFGDGEKDEEVMEMIDKLHTMCTRSVLRAELSRLDSVIAFERLEACRDLELAARKKAILTGMFLRRAGTVCIGLEGIGLPALISVEILDALIPHDFTMHFEWQVITAVKHFHDRQSDVRDLRARNKRLEEQLHQAEQERRAAEAEADRRALQATQAEARMAALMAELRQVRGEQ